MAGGVTWLMTVYAGTAAAHLDAALASLWAQTRPAAAAVVVADGPLTAAQEAVLAAHAAAHPELRLVRLPVNRGAGPAAAAGLAEVATEWVARLDADDIAAPERLARQLPYAEARGLDVAGTALAEFDDAAVAAGASPGRALLGVRRLPAGHDRIAAYARWNSPVNHPSALLRVAAVRAAGGYRDRPMMEDYDLWARMLARGARFGNMAEPLTLFRGGDAALARRTGAGMFAAERRMQATLVAEGLVSRPRAALNLLLRTGYRLLPAAALRRLNRVLFHRRRGAAT